jgi:hypothetical protein
VTEIVIVSGTETEEKTAGTRTEVQILSWLEALY